MPHDLQADRWLRSLPDELAAQRVVLERLLAAVREDPVWRWMELAGSVARGAGDRESDLDLGLGAADDRWPGALDLVPGLVARLGEIVDMLRHRLPDWGDRPHQRVFVQYGSGVQLDLAVLPAKGRGLPPGSVALHDLDGQLARSVEPSVLRASAGDVHEWAFLGWVALGDLAKYLRRGSLWEALQRLAEARNHAWRLHAVTVGADYPLFGLTSVLDTPGAAPPPGADATVASLDAADLRRAALACADLLGETSATAARATGADLPHPMAAHTRHRLSESRPSPT